MSINRYAQGKIYKLVNDMDDEIYVGSTCLPLHKRLYDHKKAAKHKPHINVYQHLNSVGFEVVSIVLIESFSCNSKDELLKRERHWIDELKPSLNKVLPYRTKAEYRQVNSEKIKQANKEYREKNRDKLIDYLRKYNEANRETSKEKSRQYREANREAIREKDRQRRAMKKAESQAKQSA